MFIEGLYGLQGYIGILGYYKDIPILQNQMENAMDTGAIWGLGLNSLGLMMIKRKGLWCGA